MSSSAVDTLLVSIIKEIELQQMNLTSEMKGLDATSNTTEQKAKKEKRLKAIKQIQSLNELMKHLLKHQKINNELS